MLAVTEAILPNSVQVSDAAMPINSIYPDVEVPNVDLWTLWLAQPANYPEDHRKPPTTPIAAIFLSIFIVAVA